MHSSNAADQTTFPLSSFMRTLHFTHNNLVEPYPDNSSSYLLFLGQSDFCKSNLHLCKPYLADSKTNLDQRQQDCHHCQNKNDPDENPLSRITPIILYILDVSQLPRTKIFLKDLLTGAKVREVDNAIVESLLVEHILGAATGPK